VNENKNVIVAQSGGPTPVINNSLRGVIETCKKMPDKFGKIYAGFHGIEGVLKEELLDISAQDEKEIELLKNTPAAGSIGTCRYKLKSAQKDDSMDTANKVGALAKKKGLDLIATGIPKTIDNDVGDSEFQLIDHTPGYGSVARYWALYTQNANEENMGSCPSDPVLVVQAMGRKIGFIPAAARLADPNREIPLQIYLAESGLNLSELADNVNDQLKKAGRAIVIVSEGFPVGNIGEKKDLFGHTEYSSSEITVGQIVTNFLNKVGLKVNGTARGQVPGTDQRNTIVYASNVDLEEAYKVGEKAVNIAEEGESGYMATILRKESGNYQVYYDKVPLEKVANSERAFPKNWITENRIDVTDDFIDYAKPLIGEAWARIPIENGIMRFARFKPIFADKKLDNYTPEAYR